MPTDIQLQGVELSTGTETTLNDADMPATIIKDKRLEQADIALYKAKGND
ncbi:MAG: hypothetical protein ACI9MS_001029 [Glaciecola sp.]|jgi:hypothetical protein